MAKRYGTCEALCGVDLEVRPGQLHGLLGPNGAGKTTLLRILLGLVRRDAGTVHLLGRPLDATAGPLPDGVSCLLEASALYPYLSGRRNLDLLTLLDDGSAEGRNDRTRRTLELVGLGDQAEVRVSGYSAGMRQRLGLAAALLRAPRLLLLDEPTSFLDAAAARDVRTLVRRLADEGAAVVLSSHDMAEVEQLCETLTILDRGRVVFAGPVAELRTLAPDTVHLLQTSDNASALALASAHAGVRVAPADDGALMISSDMGHLDRFVIALGQRGIAVRRLQPGTRSLESLFLHLTAPEASPPRPEAP